MLHFPNFNPVALALGPLKIHWYGLMYLLSFLLGWWLATWRAKNLYYVGWSSEQIADLIFYAAVGVIVGGRCGYMLFYALPTLLNDPLTLFKVWEGGMSFHGGMLGVGLATWLFSRRFKKSWFDVVDFIAPLVPVGLAAGRLGNFINGELWGRVTNMPWGMIFPGAGPDPRHPSQLYEFLLEGVLLFIILWWFAAKPRPRFAVTAVFLTGYSICRIMAECFREPDPQLGYLAFHWLTMGQLLSLPMLMVGIGSLWWIYHKKDITHD